ncbi:hypothetical protein [Agromyces subbeticus]|uniref:hypothetical protein n=1 Tax=Agromyces subbeticus TaxID=293890 RepID=UPI0003B696D2|nr:hypothetical protein [Agromyces subbeticus]
MSTEAGRATEAETTDRAAAPEAEGVAATVPGVLADLETRPLAERAEGYQSLADGLRAQLEQSDPSRRS